MKNKKIIKYCLYCNKQFESYISANRQFCSYNCSQKGQDRRIGIIRTEETIAKLRHPETKKLKCETCGKVIYRPLWRQKRSKHLFCSRSCAGRFKKGKLASNWQGGKIKVNCYICGEDIYVKKYQLKT